ncbi:glycerol dehydrogenase [Clostridium ragsdalei P11]|uniref:Glycerol dehydrogenase n=1 Tax=Clostridium ragsdalei P11 TaxID=1353534 RepID=A0A1A6AZK6_9CLOT|nr:iron-containing alcohol dehydrogenase family protein [Clostridium ragsdalei]OBR95521.1 glycerol dehydrogenase [Clostridium ragsdalei P11]
MCKKNSIGLISKYIQTSGGLEAVGREVKQLGKRAFIIGGQTALGVSFDKIEQSLKSEEIDYKVHIFSGYCTIAQINRIGEEANEFNANVIIGIGGGKVLDTAKAAADIFSKKIVTVPTTAAQCAGYSILSVIYSDDGMVLDNMFLKHKVDCVIIDTNIIAKKCPSRMLAAGIGNGMAKYPEIQFRMASCLKLKKSSSMSLAMQVVKFTWNKYIEMSRKAVNDVNNNSNSQEVEDMVCANIVLTGMASSLANSGNQIAIAHYFYNCITKFFKEQQAKFFHGELVSLGLSLQMKINGRSNDEIDQYKNFLRSINLPTTLRDIQLDATEKNLRIIGEYIVSKIKCGEEDKKLIWDGMQSIVS